jgi:hypothetical protein
MTETFRPGTVCPSRRHDDLDRRPDAGRGIVVCAACRDQAEEALIEMPEWYEICAHVLDLRRPPQLRERVNGHRPRGIVLRDAVVTVRSDMLGVLASWCGLVVAERGVTGPDELDIRRLTGFLAIHLNWLLAHPAAPEMVDELGELVRAARDVVHPPTGFRTELGRCTEPGCSAIVRAEGPIEGGEPSRVGCDAGHEWGPDQWLLLRARLARELSRRDPEKAE